MIRDLNEGQPPEGRLPPEARMLWLALLALIWWLGRQYLDATTGDGLRYVGEALGQLWPDQFGQDLYVMGAAQRPGTWFGSVYADALQSGDLRMAALWLSFFGRALWVLAFLAAMQRLLGEQPQALAAVAVALLLPAAYDNVGLSAYGDPAVSLRCWAEALVLLALERHWAGRPWQSLMALALAAVGSPTMALPAGVWAAIQLGRRLRPATAALALLALGVAVVGLALADVGGFGSLLQRFDEAWWARVVLLSPDLLPQDWPPLVLAKGGCWLALLAWASWRHPDQRLRHAAQGLLAAAALLLSTWWLASWAQNVGLVQMQLWRVMWLVQWVAPVLWLTSLPPRQTWTGREWTHVAWVLAAVLSGGAMLPLLVIPALALLGPVGHWLWRSTVLRYSVQAAVGAMLLMTLAVRWPTGLALWYTHRLNGTVYPMLVAMLAEPALMLLCLGAVAAAVVGLQRRWPRAPALMAAALLLPLVGAVMDVQHAKARQAADDVADGRALRSVVPPGSVVYWDKGLVPTWLTLQRAHYVEPSEGGRLLFPRETALEFQRRADRLAGLGLPKSLFEAQPEAPRQLNFAKLRELCEDPVLGHVLVSADVPEADFRVSTGPSEDAKVSVFRCRH